MNKFAKFNSDDFDLLLKTGFTINADNTEATKDAGNHSVGITKTPSLYKLYINDKSESYSENIEDLIYSLDFFIEYYDNKTPINNF